MARAATTPPSPIQVRVTRSKTAKPGSKITVAIPDGRRVSVSIPAGVPKGGTFLVKVPGLVTPARRASAPAACEPAPAPSASAPSDLRAENEALKARVAALEENEALKARIAALEAKDSSSSSSTASPPPDYAGAPTPPPSDPKGCWQCGGLCGYKGNYADVTAHEKTCPRVRSLKKTPGKLASAAAKKWSSLSDAEKRCVVGVAKGVAVISLGGSGGEALSGSEDGGFWTSSLGAGNGSGGAGYVNVSRPRRYSLAGSRGRRGRESRRRGRGSSRGRRARGSLVK